MKKGITRFLICFLLMGTIFLGFGNNTVEASSIEVFLNGDMLNFQENLESPYFDSNSRMMIPLRTIAEELGHRVQWIQDIKTIAIDNNIYLSIADDDIYTLIEDDEIFIKSLGKKITMNTKAVIKNKKTYVPARFIVEALGDKLEYENNNGIHKINILKNQGILGSTTTQGKESYSGYIEKIDLNNNEITFKKAEMLFYDDLNIFPELNLEKDDLPGGYHIADINNVETFKLKDSTKFNIIKYAMEENVSKNEFLDAFHNQNLYSRFFVIEAKDNYISNIREIYSP